MINFSNWNFCLLVPISWALLKLCRPLLCVEKKQLFGATLLVTAQKGGRAAATELMKGKDRCCG